MLLQVLKRITRARSPTPPALLMMAVGSSIGVFSSRLLLEIWELSWPMRLIVPWTLGISLFGALLAALLWRAVPPSARRLGANTRLLLPLFLSPLLVLLHYVVSPWPDPVGALWLMLVVLTVTLAAGLLALLAERATWRASGVLGALALLVLSGGLYLITLAPTVLWADSAEFQFVPYVLGIAHPPGYPLYTLLGKLFTYLPLGNVAYRMNLMSAVFAALTIPLIYLAAVTALRPGWIRPSARRSSLQEEPSDADYFIRALPDSTSALESYAALEEQTRQRDEVVFTSLAAGVGALSLTVAPTWWSQATVAAVRSLNGFLLTLALVFLLVWARHRSDRWLIAFAFTFGLGVSHHLSAWVLAPAFLVYLLLVDHRALIHLPRLGRLALAFALPLLVYLYLPLRSAQGSPFDVSRPTTLDRFLDLVLARGFGGDVLHYGWEDLPRRLDLYSQLLGLQLTEVSLLLAALGFLAVLWRNQRAALLLGMVLVINSLISLTYRAPVISDYLIPTYIVLGVFIGGGVLLVVRACSQMVSLAASGFSRASVDLALRQWMGILVALALFTVPAQTGVASFSTWDMSTERTAQRFAHEVFERADTGATILADWHHVTALWYYQLVENRGPDLEIAYVYPEGGDVPWSSRAAEALARGTVYITNYDLETARSFRLQPNGPLVEVRTKPSFRLPKLQHPLGARLEDKVELLGCELAPSNVSPGEIVEVTLYWLALAEMDSSYTVFVHAVGADDKVWGQRDSLPVKGYHATDRWVPEEVVADRYELAISPGAPPGEYRILVGMYEMPTLSTWRRLLATDATGQPLGDSVEVGRVMLRGEREPARPVQYPVSRRFAGGLELLGYDLGENAPGSLLVSLHWRAQASMAPSEVRLEALAPDGKLLAADARKLHEARPLETWAVGEVGRTRHELNWDASLGAASYLTLHVLGDDGQGRSVLGGWWRSLPGALHLDLPAPRRAVPLWVNLGNRVLLRDYEVLEETHCPGSLVRLRLGMQALQRIDDDLSVFVHLLDDAGQVRVQSDGVPVDGGYPTLRWTKGRIVDDWRELRLPEDLPPGTYTIQVGLYRMATGERLAVLDERLAEAFQGDRVLLKPLEVQPR